MFDKIYIMFSRLANRYSDAFSCASDALAIKKVYSLLTSQNDANLINEFDLYCIGSFDISTGSFTSDGLRRVEFRNGLDIVSAEKILEQDKK